jgi:hypothetical protein
MDPAFGLNRGDEVMKLRKTSQKPGAQQQLAANKLRAISVAALQPGEATACWGARTRTGYRKGTVDPRKCRPKSGPGTTSPWSMPR